MINVTLTYPKPLDAIGALFDSVILPAALQETAEYWHREILPNHFSTGAYADYAYKPRSEEWNWTKGHDIPLVGLTESLFTMASNEYSIKTAGRTAVVSMAVPSYAKAGTGRAETEDEMTRVNDDDRAAMALVFEHRLTAMLQAALAVP